MQFISPRSVALMGGRRAAAAAGVVIGDPTGVVAGAIAGAASTVTSASGIAIPSASLVVVEFRSTGVDAGAAVTDDSGLGLTYTKQTAFLPGTGAVCYATAYAPSGVPSNTTWTWADGGAATKSIRVSYIQNVDPLNPIGALGTNSANSGTASASVTPTVNNTVILSTGILPGGSASSWTQEAGWAGSTSTTSGSRVMSGWKKQTTTSSVTKTDTISPPTQWLMVQLVINGVSL